MIALKNKIKAWLGPIWWYSIILFFAQRFGDVLNIYIGLWLVPKYVAQDQLGALLPLTQIAGVLGLPLAIILMPFSKFINTFGAKEEYGKIKALLLDVLIVVAISSVVIGIYTWHAAPLIFERLRINSTRLIWLICGITVTSLMIPLANGVLSALKKFRIMSVTGFVSTPIRLAVLLLLLPISGLLGYFASQLALNLVICLIAFWGLRGLISRDIKRESYFSHGREMIAYTLPFVVMTGVGTLSSAVQYLVIRQRLPDVESAAFYFCSRFSEIPNIIWSAIGQVYFPHISDAFEKGKSTRRILMNVFAISVVGGGMIALLLGVSMGWVFGQVGSWANYRPYAYLTGWLALTNVFRVGSSIFVIHEIACRRFGFLFYSVPLALFESLILISLTGYGFFIPYLPASWVEWMESVRAGRIAFIVWVMLASAFAQFVGMLVQFVREKSGNLCGVGGQKYGASS
jgi:O-antigen/teichoic acid export membrane protein